MSSPSFKPQVQKGKLVRWYNGRAVIATGVGVICTFVGVGIGVSGSGDSATASTDPTSTVTVTAKPQVVTKTVTARPAPQPTSTVTATRTVTAKPKVVTKVVTKTVTAPPKPAKTITVTAKPTDDSGSDGSASAPAGSAVFKVSGSAPAGVDITYGSESDNRQGGSSLPWSHSLHVDDNAQYYAVTAQLQGGGDIKCSLTIDGVTGHGHASGSYNICQVELVQGMFGGWDVA